jgi:hypothetical protein
LQRLPGRPWGLHYLPQAMRPEVLLCGLPTLTRIKKPWVHGNTLKFIKGIHLYAYGFA